MKHTRQEGVSKSLSINIIVSTHHIFDQRKRFSKRERSWFKWNIKISRKISGREELLAEFAVEFTVAFAATRIDVYRFNSATELALAETSLLTPQWPLRAETRGCSRFAKPVSLFPSLNIITLSRHIALVCSFSITRGGCFRLQRTNNHLTIKRRLSPTGRKL